MLKEFYRWLTLKPPEIIIYNGGFLATAAIEHSRGKCWKGLTGFLHLPTGNNIYSRGLV